MTLDLDAIARDFQATDEPPAELVLAARRGTKKIRDGYLVGGLILAFLTAVSVYVVSTERSVASVLFAVIQVGVGLASLVWHHVSSGKVLGAAAHSTRAYLDLEIERQKRKLQSGRFLAIELAVVMPLLVTWHVLLFRDHPPEGGGARAVGIVGVVTPYLIFLGILLFTWRRTKRAREEKARLEALRASFEG